MKQIGLLAGVSSSTVSRVLGGIETKVPINPETRERVINLARDLGYRPNPLARGLRGASTALLGLIVRNLAYPLHTSFIHAIVEEARRNGYHVIVGSSSGVESEVVQLEQILETRACDGVIMIGGLDNLPGLVGQLRDAYIPVVGLGLGTRDSRLPIVRSDNAQGAIIAHEHLASLGHTRVGLIVPGVHPELQDRARAFMTAAAASGNPVAPEMVVRCANTLEGAGEAISKLMSHTTPPTAVFVLTDWAAIGVLRTAAAMGVRVPLDLSIVGFDDIAFSAAVTPGLTTIRQDVTAMAQAAVRLVVEAVTDPQSEYPSPSLCPVSLVVRGTTGRVGQI